MTICKARLPQRLQPSIIQLGLLPSFRSELVLKPFNCHCQGEYTGTNNRNLQAEMVRQNRIRQATAFNGRGSRPFQDDKVAVGYISIIHITLGTYYIRKLPVLEEFVKLGWLLYLFFFFSMTW